MFIFGKNLLNFWYNKLLFIRINVLILGVKMLIFG